MSRSAAQTLVAVVVLSLCILSGCVKPDTTPPGDVTGFSAQALDSRIDCTWTNPADADLRGVKVQRKADGYSASPEDGQTIYNGTGQSVSDTGLDNGVPYYYTAYAYDNAGNYSSGAQLTATPVSGAASPEILQQFSGLADDLRQTIELPPDEIAGLAELLDEALHAYEGADPCAAAQKLGEYEVLAQEHRQIAGADGMRRGRCEALYNAGRLLRYDMLAGNSAKNQCPGQERVGETATATADNAQCDNKKLVASATFGEPRLLTEQVGTELFTRIVIPGAPATPGDFGTPAIPFVTRLFGIPQGAEVTFEVTAVPAESFHANLFPVQDLGVADREHLAPVTPPANVISYAPPFTKNPAVYATDRPVPSKLVTAGLAGTKRGLHIFAVQVAAGQYNPVSQELTLYKKIDIKAAFKNGKTYFISQANLGAFENAQNNGSGGLLNGSIIGSFMDQTVHPLPDDGEEFLILTHPDFYQDCVRLAAWKNQNGLVTKVHVVCDGAGLGEDTPDAIRNYTLDRYLTKQIRPSYVLLMGDLQHIPPFYVESRIHPGETICTDFPYSKLVEHEYEPLNLIDEDVFADVALGRVPAELGSDAQCYVDDVIAYEKTPPNKPNYYKRATLASHFQCCWPWGEEGVDQTNSIGTVEHLRNVLVARGYEPERIYKETTDWGNPDAVPPWPPYTGDTTPRFDTWGNALPSDIGPGSGFNWNGTNTDVADVWKEGRFLILHMDHGWPGGWGAPWFDTGDVYNSLYTHVNERPFVFSINCSSGLIDQKLLNPADNSYSFVQLLFWAPCQVMGIVAASRTTGFVVNGPLLTGYLDALFPETLDFGPSTLAFPRLGDVFTYGTMALIGQWPAWFGGMVDHVMSYQCYGDPTVAIRTANPYPFYLPESVDLQFNGAALEALYAVDGATLTVMRTSPASGQLTPVGRGTVHNGVAAIQTISAVVPGEELSVAIGAPNAIAVRTTAHVKPGT